MQICMPRCLIFFFKSSSTTTKRTNCGPRPMPANSMWSILTMPRYWRLSILLLLVWIHWLAAKLQTRVRCQLRMCQQQGLHERKVQGPLPWLLWPECPVQRLQPHSYVHLHSGICRRSIRQLSASSTTTSRYFNLKFVSIFVLKLMSIFRACGYRSLQSFTLWP
jgi:hypothetical protein